MIGGKIMAVQLNEHERRLLLALWTKGPAMPLELAARCYSFPDEIAEPLKMLRAEGLVEARTVNGGRIGGNLVYLSRKGIEVAQKVQQEQEE